jgi:hypothetical protein
MLAKQRFKDQGLQLTTKNETDPRAGMKAKLAGYLKKMTAAVHRTRIITEMASKKRETEVGSAQEGAALSDRCPSSDAPEC